MGLFAEFADVLSYPGPDTLSAVDRWLAELSASGGESGRVKQRSALARDLLAFRTAAEPLGLAGLEEAYTRAFDLEPASCLYVGHHVFGETTRRSLFMAGLSAMYREAGGPDTAEELPDHLPHVLRYLDSTGESTTSRDLLSDAVVPAVRQILAALDRTGHPYAPLVRALLQCAEIEAPQPTATGAAV